MRVAVCQFATSSIVQNNLANCIRMIKEVATCKPSLIVLPEFSNTRFYKIPHSTEPPCDSNLSNTRSCYVDHDQAWHEALLIDGDFLQAIGQQAKNHACYIVINVTMRRDISRKLAANIKSNISITSCLFSPSGELIHQEDKQTLTGHENDFFTSSSKTSEVITTPFGKIGMLTGSDTKFFESSRHLALNGAQLLCNSSNACALDQSNLHDPARAFENNIFLATANKIGHSVAGGQSQIISANGQLLARISHNEEGFVFADIDLFVSAIAAGLHNKCRPDGTSLVQQLRPELYQTLTQSKTKAAQHGSVIENANNEVPVTTNVAIFATYKSNEQAIEDVCQYIENNLTDIIQLPELFFIADKTITHNAQKRTEIAQLSEQLITQVSAVLRPFQYLCTSLIIDGIHQAVLISDQGLLATQAQLHFCQRYQWTTLGNELNIIELPLEQGKISLAMLTADDANIPEIVKVAADRGIHVLLVPFDIQEPGEVDYSLIARAAENRICIVAASREKSFVSDLPNDLARTNADENANIFSKNKVKAPKSTGLIANLTTDARLLPQWRAQAFTGYTNRPLVKLQYGKITKAVIHPIAACTKQKA